LEELGILGVFPAMLDRWNFSLEIAPVDQLPALKPGCLIWKPCPSVSSDKLPSHVGALLKAMTSSIFRRGRAPNPSAEDDGNFGLTHLNPALEANASGLGDQRTSFEVDIVAIHGINGHPFTTWTHEDGVCWIRDFLPGHLPGARIFTFGYESKVAFTLSTGGLGDFARSLLVALTGTRKSREVGAVKEYLISSSTSVLRLVLISRQERHRPIIFVCHSMGGIVVKKVGTRLQRPSEVCH
jgi:hypothetical protein